jgi:hypothetical protein
MVALAFMAFGTANAAAQTETAEVPVKMTYIDQSHPDSIIGVTDTIRAGYNKAAAVGSPIGFAYTDWGCNWIGVLGVDVSAVPGTIQKATLKAKISGSTDSKRTTGWGVALTDNAFSADITYTTAGEWAPSALLNGGAQVWTAAKAGDKFEEHEWDITEALSGGKTSATLLVFETAAAGGYMTKAYVELEIEEYESTSKEIDFEDGDVSMFSIFNANENRMSVTAVDDATTSSKVAQFNCSSNGKIAFASFDHSELTKQATMVFYSFDFNPGNVSGQSEISIADALIHTGDAGGFTAKNNWGYGTKGVIFNTGSERGKLDGSNNENYFGINGVAKAGSTLDMSAVDDIFGQWLHAEIMVNVEAKTVSYVISKGEEDIFAENGIAWRSADASAATQFDIYFANTGTILIDNLEITSFKSNATFADYTVKYVDATGNELKDARTGNVDTAGRLHIDTELMEELQNIMAATEPDEIMLVVDAMTGQDAVNVAKAFDDALGIDSVLMSKLDSDTRGGAALSVLAVTGKPIKYVGMGEKLDDFEKFHPSRMASRILGMGDVLTLIERAENVIDHNEAEKLTRKITQEGTFDMNDLLDQLRQIRKMGSLKSIVSMLPGGDKVPDEQLDDNQFNRLEALITSMTPAERAKPSIINPSRKRRIAAGSGNKVEDVNRLLKQYEQMQKVMKKLGGGKGKKGKAMMRQAKRAFAGMDMSKMPGVNGLPKK